MGCGVSSVDSSAPVRKAKEFQLTANDLIKQRTGKISKDYIIIKPPIGNGTFGKVYKAIHKVSEVVRAVKMIRANPQEREKIKQEVLILKKLDHPNIIKVHEFYEQDNHVYIVSELCTGGELFDKISKGHKFTERDAALVMRQILSAVSYCHSNKIVHRDIKPENLLYESSKSNTLKLVDFGTSQMFKNKMNQQLGTAYYIAPEVLEQNYNEKCDVWSCGVILYILLCGQPPFQGETELKILDKIRIGKYDLTGADWDMVSDSAKELVQNMLQKNPKERCSAFQALQNLWIQQFSQIFDEEIKLNILKNMQTYHVVNKFQEYTWIYMVNNLSSRKERQLAMLAFQALDLNHDGTISKDELIQGYATMMTREEAEIEVSRIMLSIDKNNSNEIDYTEFLMATTDRKKFLDQERLEKAFQLFDTDNSGTISWDEVRDTLGGDIQHNQKVWEEMINEVDLNGDGQIQFEEFKEIMLKLVID